MGSPVRFGQYFRLVHNVFFRSKRILAFYLLLLILATVKYLRPGATSITIHNYGSYDIVSQRSKFNNPIFADWIVENKNYLDMDLESKCKQYFHAVDPKANNKIPGNDLVDLEYHQNYQFSNWVYKKKKWLRERRKTLRTELRKENPKAKITKEHEILMMKQFDEASKAVSEYELQVMNEVDHLKVFGKCFIDNDNISKQNDQLCSLFERKLYPWMSKRLPRFENWKGDLLPENSIPVYDEEKYNAYSKALTGCFLDNIKAMSNGKGLVIPVLPNDQTNQVEHIIRLIQTLRALKNELPVEIVYMGQDLNVVNRKRLIEAARTEISSFPESYQAYFKSISKSDDVPNFVSTTNYPKQDLWFVDLLAVKNKLQHPLVAKANAFNSPSFVLLLATIFNSFEEFIVLSSEVIPLVEKFDQYLFKQQSYKENGIKLFKKPSYYQLKMKRYDPGFHEISSFIKNHLMPSNDMARFFGLNKRKPNIHSTGRILDEGFASLLDPSLMVINKSKVLNGLLLSCNLQIYKILEDRFKMNHLAINAEYIWLGQEVSGVSSRVNFNNNFGVAVGVVTPQANIPKNLATHSQEICSSSWGQLDDTDDYTLLYVTDHQLEKWHLNEKSFEAALKQKYSIQTTEEDASLTGSELYDRTFAKSPLFIDAVMNPAVVKRPIPPEESKEPHLAWMPSEDFGGDKGATWWCAYNIVGSVNAGYLGKFVDYNDNVKAKFRFIIDVWLM